ncbi:MAG: cold shock-like protein CspA [Pseudomonadota bacterium]
MVSFTTTVGEGVDVVSRDAFSFPPAGGESLPGPARVKWFNATKGFGFVAPDDGGEDAFLHASVLSRAGLAELAEGQQIICVIGPGPKGPQVVRIVDVVGGAPAAAPRRDRGGPPAPDGPEVELAGTVKWFKTDKGFGFVLADDGEKDVFIHMNTLRRCGLGPLDTGQRVTLRVVASPKGREAVWIDLE